MPESMYKRSRKDMDKKEKKEKKPATKKEQKEEKPMKKKKEMGLTAGQKKLPKKLQEAILKKQKSKK